MIVLEKPGGFSHDSNSSHCSVKHKNGHLMRSSLSERWIYAQHEAFLASKGEHRLLGYVNVYP